MAPTKDPYALDAVDAPEVSGDLTPKPTLSRAVSGKLKWVGAALMFGFVAIFLVAFDKLDKREKGVKAAAATAEKKPVEPPALTPEGLPPGVDGGVRRGTTAKIELPASEPTMAPVAVGDGKGKGDPVKVPALGAMGGSGKTPPMGGAGGVPATGSAGGGQQGAGGHVPPEQMSPEMQRALAAQNERAARMQAAKLDGMEIKPWTHSGISADDAGGKKSDEMQQLVKAALQQQAAGANAAQGGQGMPGVGMGGNGQNVAANDQADKLKWLGDADKALPDVYHKYRPTKAVSALELKAGTLIPAVLEWELNSDLPGMAQAMVRENVYDSVRQEVLLIPAGSQLFGRYNSVVALGQQRMMVVWNQLQFPNGDELYLAGTMSNSMGGQSGLDSDVDNHYMRLFGVALGMSVVTAGVQLSMPQPQTTVGNTTTTPSSSQIITQALTQQYGQLGAQIMGKFVNVQPTLRNYVGERFNLVLSRNVVFEHGYKQKKEQRSSRGSAGQI